MTGEMSERASLGESSEARLSSIWTRQFNVSFWPNFARRRPAQSDPLQPFGHCSAQRQLPVWFETVALPRI